ncbi:MAG TPA: trigger factor [Prolixibacteraceae bacterium]|nr:trigger factor [Prolixibacteraceae bacterium]
MNITRVNTDELNAVLKINIEKADYEKTVAEQLKEYRQKASIPGFRPGKVPDSIIKRRFRVPVMVDEVNKLLSQKLSEYLVDEKLHILGEPLPNEELQQKINWETDENFEFDFDIALAPKVNIEFSKNDVIPYYQISASEETIDKQIEMAKTQLGENVPDDVVKENSTVRGDFVQLGENGEPVENGIQPKSVAVAIDLIKNEEIKNSFIGKKKDDVVVFDPVVAFENRHEIKHLLNIKKEEAEALNSNFSYTITEVLKFEEASLDEELFKKLYGEETDVKTVEDFRNRIKNEIEANLVYSSNQKFAIDTRDKLLADTNLQLPETFLKRWLVAINKELTVEQIEKEFDDFLVDLRWQLIKDTIIKENEIKVIPEEAHAFATEMARAQYNQYGIYDIPQEQLDSFAKMILEKEEEKERIYKRLYEDKVVKAVKDKVTLQETPVSQEDFNQMMQ